MRSPPLTRGRRRLPCAAGPGVLRPARRRAGGHPSHRILPPLQPRARRRSVVAGLAQPHVFRMFATRAARRGGPGDSRRARAWFAYRVGAAPRHSDEWPDDPQQPPSLATDGNDRSRQAPGRWQGRLRAGLDAVLTPARRSTRSAAAPGRELRTRCSRCPVNRSPRPSSTAQPPRGSRELAPVGVPSRADRLDHTFVAQLGQPRPRTPPGGGALLRINFGTPVPFSSAVIPSGHRSLHGVRCDLQRRGYQAPNILYSGIG